MNIGIIGQGFVGNAVYQKLKNFFNVYTFDIKSELSNSSIDLIKEKCSVVFICVPTPMNPDLSCDTSIVESVIKSFSDLDNIILINKSTVPPGTTDLFNKKYKKIDVVFNPEFLTEKNAVEDFNNLKRIIIGGTTDSTNNVEMIFKKAFPNATIVKTDSKQAEMIKYFTNCFLATKISFANEIYDLCLKLNIDYQSVIKIAFLDNRIGKSHLNVPGHDGDLGFGGHCFPKDLSALIKISDELGSQNNVLRATLTTNDNVRTNRDWEKMIGRAIN